MLELRPRQRFLNRPMLLALLVALLLHLIPLFLFDLQHIALPTLPILRPTLVTSELGLDVCLVPSLDPNGLLPRPVEAINPPTPHSTPTQITPPPFSSPLPPPALPTKPISRSYTPAPPGALFDRTYSPLTIRIAGPIRRLQLAHPLPTEQRLCPGGQQTQAHLLRYKIRVDERTGTLYSQTKEFGPPHLEAQAQEALKRLAFIPRPRGAVAEGFVEIIIETE